MPRNPATARRREVILDVVCSKPGLTFRALLDELRALHDEGRWPQADWPGARQDPYDVGLRQLLGAMVRDGQVREIEAGVGRVYAPAEKRKHCDLIFGLKAEGKTVEEIAEELGLGKSIIYAVLNDPFGSKERQRKRRYCPACGTKKDPRDEWCPKCVGQKAAAMMPPPEESAFWQNAMARARARGVEFVLGVTPDFRRIIRVDTGRGRFDRVLHKGEDFENAARELELL